MMENDRKKYDLSGKEEEYPGVFKWNYSWYILVKDGEHYPIARKKMEIMAKECRGKWEEIVKWYKPRKKREKDPNAPVVKSKAQRYLDAIEAVKQERLKSYSGFTWIRPDHIDPKDGHTYDKFGVRLS